MVNLLRGAGQQQMHAPIGLATAHAYVVPGSVTIIGSLLARTGATWTVGTKSVRCRTTATASRRWV